MERAEILQREQTISESQIQHTCFRWFNDTFPRQQGALFSVPNGGWRGARAAMAMRYEGQVNGVSDLIWLHASATGDRHGLCIEMKTPKRKGTPAGRQSDSQKQWQQAVESNGYTYVVCHGLFEFIQAVCDHMGYDVTEHTQRACQRYPLYIK